MPKPSFLAPGLPRMDALTFGFTLGASFGVWVEGPTLYWRHVMLVPLHLEADLFHVLPFIGTFGVTAESLVGFGGYRGPRDLDAHWGILGVGGAYRGSLDLVGKRGTTRMASLLLLAAYEYRHRYGEGLRRAWGVRFFVGWMPVYWLRYEDITCDGGLFCEEHAPRLLAPVVAGLSMFVALQ